MQIERDSPIDHPIHSEDELLARKYRKIVSASLVYEILARAPIYLPLSDQKANIWKSVQELVHSEFKTLSSTINKLTFSCSAKLFKYRHQLRMMCLRKIAVD